MATFLALAQTVASESGVIPGRGRPSTVATTDQMESRVVAWVRSAWADIQTDDRNWRWMRSDFDVPLTIGTAAYSGIDLDLPRQGQWLPFGDYGDPQFTVRIDSSDEGFIAHVNWSMFRREYLIGEPRSGRPTRFAIDDAGRIVLYPTPDAAFRLRGVYRRKPQILSADGDVPECPEEFHDAIVYKALIKADVFDEAPGRVNYWIAERNRIMAALRRDQTPRLVLGRALA